MRIRAASDLDADTLATLVASCMQESYPGHPGSSPAELRRDVLTTPPGHHVLLAEPASGGAIGFVAWDMIYDMHWATRGAAIADLYVDPVHRGVGVALKLLAATCTEVRALGGAFLRGGAYDRAATRRFYGRIAVVDPAGGEARLGGRAFRRMAELSGRSIRQMLGALPDPGWNFEA